MVGSMVTNIFKLLDQSASEAIKQHAINTVNLLILTRAPFINENMENYMKHIITMKGDPSSLV